MTSQTRDLEGKVAIVTGAGVPDAVGAVTARALAEAGASVVIADLARTQLAEVAAALTSAGFRAAHRAVDLVNEDSVKALIDFTVSTFGRLDIIDNNAAATHLVPHDKDILSMTLDLWDQTLAVNVRGPMLMCKHGVPHMLKAGGGAIINISSGKSLVGDLDGPAYAASKAALNSLTQMIATLYGSQGVRCNTVVNGVIRTPLMKAMLPEEMQAAIAADCLVPRLGEPLDIANAVVFLASERAAYITGQAIAVDGGMLAHVPHYRWRRSDAGGTDLNRVD